MRERERLSELGILMNFVTPLDNLEPPVLDDNLRADRRDGIPDSLYKINELLFIIALQGAQKPVEPVPGP